MTKKLFSLSKSTGFSLNINNVTNSTTGSIIVIDNTGNLSGSYSAPIVSGNNAINITPANLSALSTTTGGNIVVILGNYKAYVLSGKDFQFVRESQYIKTLKIKP